MWVYFQLLQYCICRKHATRTFRNVDRVLRNIYDFEMHTEVVDVMCRSIVIVALLSMLQYCICRKHTTCTFRNSGGPLEYYSFETNCIRLRPLGFHFV